MIPDRWNVAQLNPSFVVGNASTTPCALTKPSAISPRANSWSAGNLNKRKSSVTNHVDEYRISRWQAIWAYNACRFRRKKSRVS